MKRLKIPVAKVYCNGNLICDDANEYEVRLLMREIRHGLEGTWEIEFKGVRHTINETGRMKILPSGFMDLSYQITIPVKIGITGLPDFITELFI